MSSGIILMYFTSLLYSFTASFIKCSGNGDDGSGWDGPPLAAGAGMAVAAVAETDYG